MAVTADDHVADLAGLGPQTLSDGSLPLRPWRVDTDRAPALMAWSRDDARAAADLVRAALEGAMRIEPSRVVLEPEHYSPAEADRRQATAATYQTLSRGRGPDGRAVLAHCDRCHLPLRDPVSARLGIGPECLKHYDKAVIRAVRTGARRPTRRGIKLPQRWMRALKEDWPNLAFAP